MDRQRPKFVIHYECDGKSYFDIQYLDKDIPLKIIKDCFEMAMSDEDYHIISMNVFFQV